ncbi:LPXTG cell wall anchor domain-containing protein, partial [Clostridium sp. D2Q-11]
KVMKDGELIAEDTGTIKITVTAVLGEIDEPEKEEEGKEDSGKLPQTGEKGPGMYYGLGTILLGLGFFIRKLR